MTEHPILFSGPMVRAILEGRKNQTRRIVKPVQGYEHNNICRPDLAKYADAVWWHGESERVGCLQKCPFGTIGDRLWVRESFAICLHTSPATDEPMPVTNGDKLIESATFWIDQNGRKRWHYDGRVVCYRATSEVEFCDGDGFTGDMADREDMPSWKPSIHMPRWASRITLEITDIRVQRLQEITEEDARAEGIAPPDEHKTNILTANEWSKERIASLYINQFKSLWDSINAKRAPWASNPWVWALTFKRVMP